MDILMIAILALSFVSLGLLVNWCDKQVKNQ